MPPLQQDSLRIWIPLPHWWIRKTTVSCRHRYCVAGKIHGIKLVNTSFRATTKIRFVSGDHLLAIPEYFSANYFLLATQSQRFEVSCYSAHSN